MNLRSIRIAVPYIYIYIYIYIYSMKPREDHMENGGNTGVLHGMGGQIKMDGKVPN
jgi:hypothetical protein